MGHIFYFMAIFAIVFELQVLFNTRGYLEFVESINNKEKDKKPDFKQSTFILLSFFYLIWGFTGLMTSQWVLFLVLIILSFIPKGKGTILRKIDAILSFVILMFILLNKYHLHYVFF